MQVSSAFSTVMRTDPIALLAAPISVPIYELIYRCAPGTLTGGPAGRRTGAGGYW